MKKYLLPIIMTFVVILNMFSATNALALGTPPQVVSEGAILIDMATGRVLFEQNADKRLYPASTTKIMTAVLALENLQLDSVAVASYDAVMSIPVGGSNMGILEGEQITIKELLYGALVASANEACNVIAEYMSGDVDSFVAQMNEKAVQIGMTGTKFLNPHGLHSPEHYTTTRDMAILARYAMQNETFREIVSTPQYIMEPTNKYNEQRILTTTNHLISLIQTYSYYYPKATGIKTGYTRQAGNCLVSSASKGGTNFIAVTLNAEPQADAIYSFIDSKALFEYGFSNYETHILAKPGEIIAEARVKEGRGTKFAKLEVKSDVEGLLPKGADISKVEKKVTLNENITAPIKAGDVLGRITYTYDGYELGSGELVSNADIKRDFFMFILNRIFDFFNIPWIKIPLILIIGWMICIRIRRAIRRKKRRKFLRSKRY